MKVRTLADIYDQIAEGFAEAALLMRTMEAIQTSPEAPQAAAPSFDDLPPDEWTNDPNPEVFVDAREFDKRAPHGSTAVCPAHNIPYRKGKFGPYCPSTSDDPNWSNTKGYCTVTPKSAAAWLRQHA